jgi:hypothetical protein
MSTSLTLFVNTNTGERLDRLALDRLREKAHRLFDANTSIFEDELDALNALGIVSILNLEPEFNAA